MIAAGFAWLAAAVEIAADLLFADFRWYRRERGGLWYHVYDTPPLTRWTRAVRPSERVIDMEDWRWPD